MDRNGPTSLPLGLIVPMIAAMTSSTMLLVSAKTSPAKIISPAPIINMRRRPIRSATMVIGSEMSASPISVRLRTSPICVSASPTSARYRASTMARKP